MFKNLLLFSTQRTPKQAAGFFISVCVFGFVLEQIAINVVEQISPSKPQSQIYGDSFLRDLERSNEKFRWMKEGVYDRAEYEFQKRSEKISAFSWSVFCCFLSYKILKSKKVSLVKSFAFLFITSLLMFISKNVFFLLLLILIPVYLSTLKANLSK